MIKHFLLLLDYNARYSNDINGSKGIIGDYP